MKAVNLTRQLVLEVLERVPDGAGGFSESWVPLGTLWAEVKPRSGRVRDGGDMSLTSLGLRIVVRGAPVGAPSRPQAGMRFREGVRLYSITAVSEHDRNGRYLICHAKEEAAI